MVAQQRREVGGRRGDGDALDVRRARAVGVLADPQRALRFTTGTATLDDGYGPVREDARSAVLYLHLDASDLRAGGLAGPSGGAGGVGWGGGVVRCESLGPMLTEQLHAWLLGSKVVVRPVLDLRRQHPVRDAVDAHDPPEWMAELVRLRDPWCVHPGCGRESRGCDLDHITPYQPPDEGGPPGQTNPGNLAPLCRRHHRAKTFGGWHYQRRDDGGYRWTTPLGRTVDVPPPRRRPRPPR